MRPTPLDLLLLFLRIGVLAFGGGVTIHLQHHLVARGWASEAEVMDALNWCQNLPGPNATNLAAYFGYRHGGVWTALGCCVALVLPGAVAVLLLAWGVLIAPQQAAVKGSLVAVAAAAVGLLLGAIWRLLGPALGSRARTAAAFVAFGAVVVFGLPTPVVIVILVGVLWSTVKPLEPA